MFVGHYSASFTAKAVEKRIPLWLLFIAVQFVDVLWAIFVLLGIEKVRIVPGITASNPLDLYYMPYTHSLVGALGWSVLGFLGCQIAPRLRGARTGLIVALVIFSHWILDLIVHRPDLALYDNVFKMGFGLWNYRVPEFILEIALLISGAALYFRTAIHKNRIIGFGCLLVLVQVIGTFFSAPPSSDRAEALMALLFYSLFAAGAWWVERHKIGTQEAPATTKSADKNLGTTRKSNQPKMTLDTLLAHIRRENLHTEQDWVSLSGDEIW